LGLPAQPSPEPSLSPTPVGAQWENGIALADICIPAQAIPAGEQLALRLHWHTTQPVLRDLTVFSHLVDENGEIVAQQDERPFAGRWPTTVWPVNQHLIDEVELAIPENLPTGMYALRLGLYDANGRIPLVSERGDYLLLEDLIAVSNPAAE
jgi:hypothetical protein